MNGAFCRNTGKAMNRTNREECGACTVEQSREGAKRLQKDNWREMIV